MYNLIEYSQSNYSDATASLWFYSKNEVANFNVDIGNTDNFKSFKCKVKILEKPGADEKCNNCCDIKTFE